MNPSQERLTRALETYAASLSEIAPSPQLEARMQAAIEREVTARPRGIWQQRAVERWALGAWALRGWALAASVLLALGALAVVNTLRLDAASGRTAALAQSTRDRSLRAPAANELSNAAMVFPTGAVSLWPTQGTVFRVRSTLNGAQFEPQGSERQWAEQQYWIDVRVANDGSMRIERVLSADGTELFARPGIAH